jgi:hypothetical protein
MSFFHFRKFILFFFYCERKSSAQSQSYTSCWLPFVPQKHESSHIATRKRKFLYIESPRMREKNTAPLLPSLPIAFLSVNWNHQVWFARLFVGVSVWGGGGCSVLPGTTTCCRAFEWGQLRAVAGVSTTNVCISALHKQQLAPPVCSTTLPKLTALNIEWWKSANYLNINFLFRS